MRNLFFYGTLRHVSLLETVLGRGFDSADLAPVRLPDYAVFAVAEGPFPMIEKQPGGQAEGLLVKNLTTDDIARLDFYEGSFAYDLVEVTLDGGQCAEVYVPQPGLWTADGPWDLQDWIQTWGALSCLAAEEVMGYFGTRDRDEVAQMFPVIRARAASKLRAATSRHGARTHKGQAQVEQVTRSYAKFFAVDDVVLRHDRFDGTQSDRMERGVFIAADAALVLPYDPITDQVLLVEQMRVGPLMRGDRAMWQLEPIAGRIDPGETPQEAARREALEEAGLTLGALETIAEVYPSPGTSTEFYYIFMGLSDLSHVTEGLGGLEAEDEDIKSHILSFAALMQLVSDIAVANAPLALTAYWLAHHRERLRSAGVRSTPDAK